MRRKTHILVSLLLAIGALTAFGSFHEIEVVDEYGVRIPNADIFSIRILNPNSDTNATIYKEGSLTNAITQPITASSTNTTLVTSVVRWYGLDIYDIIVRHYNGNEVRRRGNNSSDGTIILPIGEERHPENIVIDFVGQPVVTQEDGTTASGTDTEINVMMVDGGHIMEFINIATATIIVPNSTATGLDIARDQTENDAIELGFGILAGGPGCFTVGTDPAFFLRLKFSSADVTGHDECFVGFRKAEAYQTTLDALDEMAGLNNISGDINIETIINGATNVTTDTTDNWADGETHTFQINVSAAGVVTYLIDGVAPTVTAAFTFDDAEDVVPMIFLRHDADLADTLILEELEIGFQ